MDKFILVAGIFTLVVSALSIKPEPAAAFNIFAEMSTADWPMAAETYNFKVEAYGTDLRVYQFRSEENPDVVCTVVASEKSGTSTSCVHSPKDLND